MGRENKILLLTMSAGLLTGARATDLQSSGGVAPNVVQLALQLRIHWACWNASLSKKNHFAFLVSKKRIVLCRWWI